MFLYLASDRGSRHRAAGRLELDNQSCRWHHGRVLQSACAMKLFFLKFFTWWSGQTFGTQLWTWRFGELVGTDAGGNRYYRTKGGVIDPTLGFQRRWVVLQRLCRIDQSRRGLARLAASHRRCRADRRNLCAARMAEAASAEPDGHADGVSSVGLDPRQRQAPQGNGRLSVLDAGVLMIKVIETVAALRGGHFCV